MLPHKRIINQIDPNIPIVRLSAFFSFKINIPPIEKAVKKAEQTRNKMEYPGQCKILKIIPTMINPKQIATEVVLLMEFILI